MHRFLELFYRYSRLYFVLGIIWVVGGVVLDIWPQRYPHASVGDWLGATSVYFAALLAAGALTAGGKIAFEYLTQERTELGSRRVSR